MYSWEATKTVKWKTPKLKVGIKVKVTKSERKTSHVAREKREGEDTGG